MLLPWSLPFEVEHPIYFISSSNARTKHSLFSSYCSSFSICVWLVMSSWFWPVFVCLQTKTKTKMALKLKEEEWQGIELQVTENANSLRCVWESRCHPLLRRRRGRSLPCLRWKGFYLFIFKFNTLNIDLKNRFDQVFLACILSIVIGNLEPWCVFDELGNEKMESLGFLGGGLVIL